MFPITLEFEKILAGYRHKSAVGSKIACNVGESDSSFILCVRCFGRETLKITSCSFRFGKKPYMLVVRPLNCFHGRTTSYFCEGIHNLPKQRDGCLNAMGEFLIPSFCAFHSLNIVVSIYVSVSFMSLHILWIHNSNHFHFNTSHNNQHSWKIFYKCLIEVTFINILILIKKNLTKKL